MSIVRNAKIETVNGKDIVFSVENKISQKVDTWKGTIQKSFRRIPVNGRVFIVLSQGITIAIHETLKHGQTVKTELSPINNLEQFITELKSHDYIEETN